MDKASFQVILVMSDILGHEKTKIHRTIDYGKIDVLLLGLTHTSRIKRWATLFGPWLSYCTRLFKFELSQDQSVTYWFRDLPIFGGFRSRFQRIYSVIKSLSFGFGNYGLGL